MLNMLGTASGNGWNEYRDSSFLCAVMIEARIQGTSEGLRIAQSGLFMVVTVGEKEERKVGVEIGLEASYVEGSEA